MSPEERVETLRSVRQTLHNESLAHRDAMFSAFSLTLTGLMAILAGILAIGRMQFNLKIWVAVAVVLVLLATLLYIARQRPQSDEAMYVISRIDNHLELFAPGAYIEGKPVLPAAWIHSESDSDSRRSGLARQVACLFSLSDLGLKLALAGLSAALLFVLFSLPNP